MRCRGKRHPPLCHPEHPDLPAASCERNEQHPQAVVATTTSNENTPLPFVIPSEAEESAVSASQYQMLTGETVLFIPSVPGFPAPQNKTRPRVRLSVRKGA